MNDTNFNTIALTPKGRLSRRGFLGATATTGLVVAFHIPLVGSAWPKTAALPKSMPGSSSNPTTASSSASPGQKWARAR